MILEDAKIKTLQKITNHNQTRLEKVDYDERLVTDLYTLEYSTTSVWNPFYDATMRLEVDPLTEYGQEKIEALIELFEENEGLDLEQELRLLGFTNVSIEADDPKDVQVKVWFQYVDKKKTIRSDGRQIFSKETAGTNCLTKKQSLESIIQWIREPKENWELMF